MVRYLDGHFYENVNSPAWRDQLRDSLGFCHEHAWLAVEKRLGDPLGFSIIYRDLVNSVLRQWEEAATAPGAQRGWPGLFGQVSKQTQELAEKLLAALTPRKRCPVCDRQQEARHEVLAALIEGLETPELSKALDASDGLCLPHLRSALEKAKRPSEGEILLTVHRAKLARLRSELDEFIRKNDYQFSGEGFGREGDAWLRAVGIVVGKRKA